MAARFWVTGGTGNWSSTTNWSATSGGGSGASVPGSADTATFNASSGVGTATVDSNVTIQTLTMTGYTGTLAFGTNTISLNSTGTVYTGATTFTVTGTPVINVTSTGSTAITVSAAAVTEANSISFNFTGGTYTLTFLAAINEAAKNVDFTGFSGTWSTVQSFFIYGNLTLSTGMTPPTGAGMTFAATSGTKTFTSNAKVFNSNIDFNGVGGTFQLADALTLASTRIVNLVNGTLNLNNKVLTTGSFQATSSNTRAIAFGTGYINCANSGTPFTTQTTTGLTVSGSAIVNITYAGASTVTVNNGGGLPEASNFSFNFTAGTYSLFFFPNVGSAAKNVDFTGFAGTLTAISSSTIYGNLTLSTGMTLTGTTSSLTFGATSGTQIITSNAKTIDFPLTFNGVGGTFRLFDNMTLGATRTATLTNGTLDLNGKSLTTGLFASSNSNTRTIAFGTGNITCNAAGGTLWTTATVTNLTVTGTPVVNISNSGAVATTVASGILTEANAISFNFTTGTYALTFLGTVNYSAKNVNFTGFAGNWNARASCTIYGNLTLSTGMTLILTANVLTFGATSGTQVITSNGLTIDEPITINGVGGTVQLADALTLGATRALTLTNGTFDGNSKTISGASTFSMVTGSVTIKNVSTALAFTLTSGALIQGAANTFGAFTWTLGNLDISNYQLNCSSFTTTGSTARTLAFGTGNITCVNTAGGTLFTTSTVALQLIVTGTPTVNISNNSANAATVTPGVAPEANSLSFNFIDGTYALTFMGNTNEAAKNVNFNGFAGTWSRGGLTKIYGNLTLSSAAGFSAAASVNALTFGATSGTQIITSNGKTHDYPITLNGVGGTVQLADALLMGTTRILAHTNGTLDLNGKTLTVGTQYQTVVGTQVLTFNGGTLTCPGVTTLAFNNAAPAGFSTVAGTGTGKISMTGATAKTFVGGGSTYNCTLSNDGAGALTISGANTFTTIANGVQPTAFVFPISVTQTVTNWTVSGTAGNLVTITSGTAGTAATLSKASGTVSSNYLSLKDSAATGGATWYAGANSTNVSGNSGWIFSNAPANAAGSFFFMF